MRSICIFLTLSFFCSGFAFGSKKEVGRHIGYLIGDYFNDWGIDYGDVIEGLNDFQRSKKPPLDEGEFRILFHKLALNNAERDAQNSLKLSEKLLDNVKNKDGVTEVIPNKLYINNLCMHSEGKILANQGVFHITCKDVNENILIDTRSNMIPITQHLEEAIKGFSIGVKGMREKERRILYIHPSLAYGDCGLLDPNLALTVDVELISIND